MGAIVSLLLGGMIGRVAGPIAQDYFENETEMGRRIMRHKEQREIEQEQRNFEQKIKSSEYDHNKRMGELRMQIEERRKDAESQFYFAYADANMRTFLRDCWPLRNPFDAPLAIEPVYDEITQRIESCKLKTISIPNHMEIVPLRFISALKNSAHPEACSINSEMSMFLVNNYSSNGQNAVFSEIGAWREDIPVNDASINYLFKGMKGQPVMVLAPEFLQNGTFIRFKVWSWGLGENLTYPVGFDFGWLDLSLLYNRILAVENKKMANILKKVNLPPTSDTIKKNEKILAALIEQKNILTSSEKDYILSLLSTPLEINSILRKNFAKTISNVFSVIVAMYSDGYHLMEYGTHPQLPTLLSEMRNIPFMIPYFCSFYQTLVNTALSNSTLMIGEAIEIELQIANSIHIAYPKLKIADELLDNVRLLNDSTEGPLHLNTIHQLRNMNENMKSITNKAKPND